ncbi:MAG: biotin--[acetyl-CoA-carboxylase] ligase [Planctomycetes bacterium]|nr:biotin--[acetyl-CoA-carboxylase] ligase [Planctomycetota bacterium]
MQPQPEPATQLTQATRFRRLVHVTSCESTQALAQEDHEPGCAAYWSDHQLAGRGRQGNTWNDSPGEDLAVTFRVTDLTLESPPTLAVAAPLALLVALEASTGMRVGLKWPNDLQVSGRKIAGVLIEATSIPAPVYLVGFGVNVNRTSFPPELRGRASSMALATGHEYDRAELLVRVASSLDEVLRELETRRVSRLVDLFRDRLGVYGKRVLLSAAGKSHSGRLTGLDLETATLDSGATVPLAIVQELRQA